MRKRIGKILACFAAAAVLSAVLPVSWKENSTVYAEGDISSISLDGSNEPQYFTSITELNTTLGNYRGSQSLNAKLQNDWNVQSGEVIRVTSGDNLTLDLNGYKISNTTSTIAIQVNGGSLTITDSSSGTGTIEASQCSAVEITGGNVNILNGNFKGNTGAVSQDAYTLWVKGGELVMQNGSVENRNAAAVFVDVSAKATIAGGSFKATNSSGYCYACYATGNSNLIISGGDFSITASSGKSLWIDENVTVSLTGGTYHNAIAKKAVTAPAESVYYKVFYGNPGSRNIITGNHILTNNNFTYEQNYVRTQSEVSIVPGSMISLNTNRSSVETYGANETDAREAADNGGIVFAGADGKLYSADSSVPVPDTARITDGNTYTWGGWQDVSGAIYASAGAYAKKHSGSDAVLTGVWKPAGSNSDAISGVGKYYLRAHTKYTLGSGQWTVDGDSTVYHGGTDFYIAGDGEFEFQKQ